jgi:hypothetical protein
MDPATGDVGSYFGTTDSGTDIYVGSGGSFVDENQVPLNIPSGTDINLATGDTITYGGGSAPAPAYNGSTSVAAPDQSIFSGLGDMFNGIGSAIGKSVQALSPSKPTSLPGQVGSFVYNPTTGRYVPAVQGTSAMSTSSLVLILGIALIAVFAFKS